MCGRVTLLTEDELSGVLRAIELRSKRLPLIERFEDAERLQARPGNMVNVLVPTEDTGGSLAIAPLIWGFTVPNGKSLVFNTRIESALGRTRLWAHAIENGRCLLPVAAFFEPHATETTISQRTGKPMKRQFQFSSPARTALLLACVGDGERVSVVTTEPNDAVAPIHRRMPLVLDAAEAPLWLGENYAGLADRSAIRLATAPEHVPSPTENPQMSLF